MAPCGSSSIITRSSSILSFSPNDTAQLLAKFTSPMLRAECRRPAGAGFPERREPPQRIPRTPTVRRERRRPAMRLTAGSSMSSSTSLAHPIEAAISDI